MNCPTCGVPVSVTFKQSAWGGPLSDSGTDRVATAHFPCGCVVEDDPIPWQPVPRPPRETPHARGR